FGNGNGKVSSRTNVEYWWSTSSSPFTTWSYAPGLGAHAVSSAVVARGIAYAGTDNGFVFAANAASGTPLWQFSTGSAVHSSQSVANGLVYVVADNGTLYALDATTGAFEWQFNTPSMDDFLDPLDRAIESSSPAVVDGIVYVGFNDG